LIKATIKSEAATASIPLTAPSTILPPLRSPATAVPTNGSVRVKAEAAESATPCKRFASVSLDMASRLNRISAVSSSDLPLPTERPVRRASRRESTHVRVKPEVVVPTIPRKRQSDVALLSENQPIDSSAGAKETPPKRAKTEVTTQNPLGQVTNTTVASASRSPAAMYSPFPMDPFNDPYTKLQNIQIEMSIQENALDHLRRKPRLSMEDQWSIASRQDELQRLRELEMETNYFLGEPQPLEMGTNFFLEDPQPVPMNWPIVKNEPVVDEVGKLAIIVNRYSSPVADRKPSVPQVFPMAMEVDRKPFIKPEPPAAPRLSFPAFPLPALERKPFVTPPTQPVASGSKGPSPPFPKYEPSPCDDFDMTPSDSENEGYLPHMDPVVNDLVDRIGIDIPPPVENDAQDDNGDYYGRGRDLFEGPRANADE